MAVPPDCKGAVHERVTRLSPGTPTTDIGALGVVTGTTDADADESLPLPALLLAETVNVYDVPFVIPTTVHDKGGAAPDCDTDVHE